jgi:hypothetical protein
VDGQEPAIIIPGAIPLMLVGARIAFSASRLLLQASTRLERFLMPWASRARRF